MLACVCHPSRAHNLPVSLEPVHRPRPRHAHTPVYTAHHHNHHTPVHDAYNGTSVFSLVSSSSSSPSSSSSSSSSTCDESNHASSTVIENGKLASTTIIENGKSVSTTVKENGKSISTNTKENGKWAESGTKKERVGLKKKRTSSFSDKQSNNNNDRTLVDRNSSFNIRGKKDSNGKTGENIKDNHKTTADKSSPAMKQKSTLERKKLSESSGRNGNKEKAAVNEEERSQIRENPSNKSSSSQDQDGFSPSSTKLLAKLPDGCELTVGELRDMANRQQQQIETQQQLLVAREQRLKYLKQQESRAAAVAAEADRLRRLRERVEAQEAKLRRLRALRGQVEATRLNTASLTTDLDAMRHLFSEKEKELVVAVSKVEELTRQLEELRHGRSPLSPNNQHHNELDKLRRELLYRNSVNREASARVDAQRETLAARRDEITRIDKRIAELQQRLHRKRILNHQLASQITAATQAKQAQLKAVQQKAIRDGIHSENSADDINTPDHLKVPQGEDLGEFGPNKNDPKYQTLPYNTKFSVTFKTKNGQGGGGGGDSDSAPTTPTGIAPPIPAVDPSLSSATTVPVNNSSVVTRTVHSIPTHPPSRGHAHAPGILSQSQPLQVSQHNQVQQPTGPIKPPPNPAMTPRVYGPGAQQFNQRSQPLGATTTGANQDSRPLLPPTSLSVSFNQKANPGLTAHSQNRNLQPVHQLQEVGNNTANDGNEEAALATDNGRVKPALPPKPAVPSKPLPPPRQKGDPLAASNESLNSAQSAGRGGSQGRSQHGFRYASQNVIVSTYTQQSSTDSQSADGIEDNGKIKSANNIHNSNANNNAKIESEMGEKVHVSINRRIEMPPDFMFPEDETPPSDLLGQKVDEIENGSADPHVNHQENGMDAIDNFNMQSSLPLTELEKLRIDHSQEDVNINHEENVTVSNVHTKDDPRKPDGADTSTVTIEEGRPEEGDRSSNSTMSTSDIINSINNNININNNSSSGAVVVRRIKKGNLKTKNSSRVPRRVSFDPLALLLDASLEGELELVRRTAMEVPNPSAANDEGITALHNAICAGHLDIVTFLVTFGCDVNAQDSDGWTPLHCAASCNNVAMVRFLVEHGACILATTLSDHETAAEKCEQDEEGYDGCSQYLYSVQEKLGIMNGGVVFGVYDYEGQATDELTFHCGDPITVLRRGDEYEREWWWGQLHDIQGYVPRNLLGLYPRVKNPLRDS